MPAFTVPTKFTARDKVSDTLTKMSRKTRSFSQKAEKGFARAERSVRKFDRATGSVRGNLTKLQGAFAGVVAAMGGAQIASTVEDLADLESKISNLFDVGSKKAQKYADQVSVISANHKVQKDEVVTAANAVTKQLGVGYEKALSKIESGFKKGANTQGEFISQLKEYPAQFQSLGLSADKALGIITQTQKRGVMSDKGVDALKEANTSLGEMPKATKEAVNKLFQSQDAADKLQKRLNTGETTMFEEIQRISKAMQGADKQTKGMVLADVFRGAGEDARGFIEEIGKLNPSLQKAEDARNKTSKGFDRMQALLVKVGNTLKRSLVPAFNEAFVALKPVGVWMNKNRGTVKALTKALLIGVAAFLSLKVALFAVSLAMKTARATMIAFNVVMGISKGLTGASAVGLRRYRSALIAYRAAGKVATAVQYAWNAALSANPIGLVVAGVAALIAVVAVVIKKWKSWGAAISVFLGPLGLVISLFKAFKRNWDMIKKAFETNGIVGGLKAIGLTILDALLQPVQKLLELVGKLPSWLGGNAASSAASGIADLRKNIQGMGEEVAGMADKAENGNLRKPEKPDPQGAQNAFQQKLVRENRETVDLNVNDPGNRTEVKRNRGPRKSNLVINQTLGR
jgi:hypothetical protein